MPLTAEARALVDAIEAASPPTQTMTPSEARAEGWLGVACARPTDAAHTLRNLLLGS